MIQMKQKHGKREKIQQINPHTQTKENHIMTI